MFEELNLEIREEVVRTLFHAEIEVEEADQLQQAQAAQALDGDGFAYAHESLAGSQAIAAAGGGAGLDARRRRRLGDGRRARRGRRLGDDPAARDERPREEPRPQRSVLVRQRQEVQALPRRVADLYHRADGRPERLQPSRSTSSSRRSGPSSPGSVITFDPDQLESRVAELEQELGTPGFWDDQQHAAQVSAEHARLTRRLERYRRLVQEYQDAQELLAMDGEMEDEIATSIAPLRDELDRLQEDALFSGEYDAGDALVTIHAGTGGTDAQDWAEMLLRMYLRWAAAPRLPDRAARGEPGGGGGPQVGDLHASGARTPTGSSRPSAASTGSSARARSTRPTAATRASRR